MPAADLHRSRDCGSRQYLSAGKPPGTLADSDAVLRALLRPRAEPRPEQPEAKPVRAGRSWQRPFAWMIRTKHFLPQRQ